MADAWRVSSPSVSRWVLSSSRRLVAWPASYGDSGVMTFIVNQQGRVYERDLGPETAKAIQAMNEYDPDLSWRASED